MQERSQSSSSSTVENSSRCASGGRGDVITGSDDVDDVTGDAVDVDADAGGVLLAIPTRSS